MFSSVFKTLLVVSAVTAVSVSALPSHKDSSTADLCHCSEFNLGGKKLTWAVSGKEGGQYHFNCHYGWGSDEQTECGYSLIGHLEKPFKGSHCPEKVAHLIC